jgi:hypothetical protein
MARLRNTIDLLLSEKNQTQSGLTWEPVGPSQDYLLGELEKLYWQGAKAEIENVIDTLRTWQGDSFRSAAATAMESPDALEGYDSFLNNVSQWSREYAEMYSKWFGSLQFSMSMDAGVEPTLRVQSRMRVGWKSSRACLE